MAYVYVYVCMYMCVCVCVCVYVCVCFTSDRPGAEYQPGPGPRDHFLAGYCFRPGPWICGSFHLHSFK